ncbi:hypothetical protein ACQEVB_38935 [Pseudonocardia sp. CA-107938]|uniref:hypothetical protein n=1 Tax=Pseudonocardia sp. CA-107938 TaxID=3240021 RepID=UPI003D9488EB
MTSAPTRPARAARAALIGLELIAGVSAVGGGIGLVAGNAIGMPADWLAATPFPDWTIPGILLIIVVAVPMLIAAYGEIRRTPWAHGASAVAGVLQIGWILAQWAVIGRYDPLQPTMLVIGCAIAVLSRSQQRSGR